MSALAQDGQPEPLPRLRDDLELVDTNDSRSGSVTQLIYDPLRHRFVRIDRGTFELLSILNECRDADDLKQKAWHLFSRSIDDDAIDDLVAFLERSEFADHVRDGDWRVLSKRRAESKKKVATRAIHSYLFFKVPLVRPQRFLETTLPLVRPLMSRTAATIVLLFGILGLYLVSRQWDTFLTTFQHAFTLNGAITFAFALAFVKTLHELGHAYVTVNYGCRVSSLGIAFMLLTPMLYTDVTDAWRLKNNRHRLWIDAAGVTVELALAAIATLLWVFLPEGPLKSIAFAIATLSWIMSLVFNLNPFMRFDGYYILSDFLKVENLQARAFALARWHLREVLFGLNAPRPEVFPRTMHATLIAYAWGTWIYRLVLFIGIALLVYTMFFKVLGIVLFVVEIAVFIAMPVMSEIKEWIAMRSQIRKSPRAYVSLAVFAVTVAFLAVPWSTRIEVPALLAADDIKQIYPVRAARIAKVYKRQGELVTMNEPLVELHSPDLERQIALTNERARMIKMRLARRAADDLDRDQSLVLEREHLSLKTKAAGLEKERAELVVRAPMAGDIIEFNQDVHEGRWVARTEKIALVGSRRNWVLRGYINEADVERVSLNTNGRFIPDDPQLPTLNITLTSVLRAGATTIDYPELASLHGGPVATRHDPEGNLIPVSAQFLATMHSPTENKQLPRTVRGLVVLNGTRQSIIARMWRQILAVLVRESGA